MTHNMTKKIILFIIAFIFILPILRSLNPADSSMFPFHDMTIYPRLQQSVLNIKNLQIPPRMAPDMNYGLGYPVFNYYAPGAYIITGLINLLGFGLITSVKLSFIMALLIGLIGSYLFLRNYFDEIASSIGSFLYVTCLYLAVDIFIRGNIGEVWFISILPLAFYFLKRSNFILTIITLFFLFSVHNLLSVLVIPILIIYCLLLPNKKIPLFAIILSLLLNSYYYLPLILENNLVWASNIATKTNYADHFLCIRQLWDSPWGYGGSIKGCMGDGMSFMLGKVQIIFFILGAGVFLLSQASRPLSSRVLARDLINKEIFPASNAVEMTRKLSIFFLLLTLGSIFMTHKYSSIIWNLLPSLKIIQFPWRFLSFTIIGISFFSAYFISKIPAKYQLVSMLIIPMLFITNIKYFARLSQSQSQMNYYLSEKYLTEKAATQIPEYFPKIAKYKSWENPPEDLSVEKNNRYIKKISTVPGGIYLLNISYFPSWQITINRIKYKPKTFDMHARPIINLRRVSDIEIKYQQTTVEQIGNWITLLTIFFIVIYLSSFPFLRGRTKVGDKHS